MDTPTHPTTSLTVSVDWIHMREAERLAAGRRSRLKVLSPVLLAICEQSRYHNGTFTADGIVLFDCFTDEPARFRHNPALKAYVVAWAQGQPLEPATFTLERQAR